MDSLVNDTNFLHGNGFSVAKGDWKSHLSSNDDVCHAIHGLRSGGLKLETEELATLVLHVCLLLLMPNTIE